MARKTKAEREAEEQARVAKQKLEATKRIEKAPAILFKMLVQAKALENAGFDVKAHIVPVTEAKYQGTPGLPGVKFVFGSDKYSKYGPGGDEYALNLEAEDWEIENVQTNLDELQAEEDENKRHRKLAEDLKASLTPEQVEALKKYG